MLIFNKKEQIHYLLLLFFITFNLSYSQENNALKEEEIKKVFKKVDTYLFDKQNADSATIFLNKLIKEPKFNFKKFESEIIYRNAIIEIKKNNIEKSLSLFIKAKKIFEENNELNKIGKCYKNMGICYEILNDKSNALKSYLNAEKLLNNEQLPSLYSNLAGLYTKLNDNQTALKYGLKGYNYLIKTKNELALIESNNILGHITLKEDKYEKALFFYNNSLRLSKKHKLNYYIGAAMANIANVESKRKNYSN